MVCRLDDNLLGIPVDCLPNPPAVQALKAKRPCLDSLADAGDLYDQDTYENSFSHLWRTAGAPQRDQCRLRMDRHDQKWLHREEHHFRIYAYCCML